MKRKWLAMVVMCVLCGVLGASAMAFSIAVQDNSGNKISLNVKSDQTIADLKNQIAEKSGVALHARL